MKMLLDDMRILAALILLVVTLPFAYIADMFYAIIDAIVPDEEDE